MARIKSLDDLKKMRVQLSADMQIRENSNAPDKIPQIKVSMGTCGISAGAKETLSAFIDELNARGLNAVVTQTGCMGHCTAEPVVEVIMPGRQGVLYGDVTTPRIVEIIEKHVLTGESASGVIA